MIGGSRTESSNTLPDLRRDARDPQSFRIAPAWKKGGLVGQERRRKNI
jgi:hypothetical protein